MNQVAADPVAFSVHLHLHPLVAAAIPGFSDHGDRSASVEGKRGGRRQTSPLVHLGRVGIYCGSLKLAIGQQNALIEGKPSGLGRLAGAVDRGDRGLLGIGQMLS